MLIHWNGIAYHLFVCKKLIFYLFGLLLFGKQLVSFKNNFFNTLLVRLISQSDLFRDFVSHWNLERTFNFEKHKYCIYKQDISTVLLRRPCSWYFLNRCTCRIDKKGVKLLDSVLHKMTGPLIWLLLAVGACKGKEVGAEEMPQEPKCFSKFDYDYKVSVSILTLLNLSNQCV